MREEEHDEQANHQPGKSVLGECSGCSGGVFVEFGRTQSQHFYIICASVLQNRDPYQLGAGREEPQRQSCCRSCFASLCNAVLFLIVFTLGYAFKSFQIPVSEGTLS